MGDRQRRPLQQLQLRRDAHHQRRARQRRQLLRPAAAPQGDHQLGIEMAAGGGDRLEQSQLAVLDRAQRGIEERLTRQLLPGEVDGGAAGRIAERSGEMKAGRQLAPRVFEVSGLLADLGQR